MSRLVQHTHQNKQGAPGTAPVRRPTGPPALQPNVSKPLPPISDVYLKALETEPQPAQRTNGSSEMVTVSSPDMESFGACNVSRPDERVAPTSPPQDGVALAARASPRTSSKDAALRRAAILEAHRNGSPPKPPTNPIWPNESTVAQNTPGADASLEAPTGQAEETLSKKASDKTAATLPFGLSQWSSSPFVGPSTPATTTPAASAVIASEVVESPLTSPLTSPSTYPLASPPSMSNPEERDSGGMGTVKASQTAPPSTTATEGTVTKPSPPTKAPTAPSLSAVPDVTIMQQGPTPQQRANRPRAVPKASQTTKAKTPISQTLYIDPCLRDKMFNVPRSLSSTTDALLTGVSALPHQHKNFSWTTGVPLDGVAKMAKQYILPPDAKFESENGGISLSLAVVDEVGPSPPQTPTGPPSEEGRATSKSKSTNKGKAKKGFGFSMDKFRTPTTRDGSPTQGQGLAADKRTQARVSVVTNKGGVQVDVLEIDPTRTLSLDIDTDWGDVLVLLPATFNGVVNFNTNGDDPQLLPALAAQASRLAHPRDSIWTVTVVPQAIAKQARDKAREKSIARSRPSGGAGGKRAPQAERNAKPDTEAETGEPTPLELRGMRAARPGAMTTLDFMGNNPIASIATDQALGYIPFGGGDYVAQVIAGFASATTKSQSKVSITTQKGRVAIGLLGADGDEAAQLKRSELRVGADSKVKHWWNTL